jgi:hypothetical protein
MRGWGEDEGGARLIAARLQWAQEVLHRSSGGLGQTALPSKGGEANGIGVGWLFSSQAPPL